MKFRIEGTPVALKQGIYIGVVVAEGLDNATVNEAVNKLLANQITQTVAEIEQVQARDIPQLAVYHDALRAAGINPAKYPCSIEAILNRIKKQGNFPSISPVVNLGNYISLKYKLPVGVHDQDTIEDALVVREANEEDCKNKANMDVADPLVVGEVVYASGNSIRTRRWMWRQMAAGRVDERAKNFIFPIDGFAANQDVVDQACAELAQLINQLFGVEAKCGVLTAEDPEFCFGQLTEEEQAIEDEIAIMLKGVAQHTTVSEIREKLTKVHAEGRPLRIKLGLDPSAPDIHIGHSVVLRKVRQLQQLGHKAIIIIGDFTGMIGDPTGKSKTRKALTPEQVHANAETYMQQIFKIIDRDKTEVYFNSEWLGKMTFADVISLASKCTVARMMERDDFNNRYTNHLPLSVHEFFYPLMQAYDSVAIRADIELGGTDQTFNILMGRNIQRDFGQDPQLTLFMPLLEGIDGVEKMSKSLGNYVGINEPASVIFEKIMKIPDSLIIKYYNLCTDVHPNEIAKLQTMMDAGTNPRDIKMMLAHEITELYIGRAAADEAEQRFKRVYQQGQIPDDVVIIQLEHDQKQPISVQLTTKLVALKLYRSTSDIRRIFAQGGAKIDNVTLRALDDLNAYSSTCVLKMGKNKFFKLEIK